MYMKMLLVLLSWPNTASVAPVNSILFWWSHYNPRQALPRYTHAQMYAVGLWSTEVAPELT